MPNGMPNSRTRPGFMKFPQLTETTAETPHEALATPITVDQQKPHLDEDRADRRLVASRLGIHASLFFALRAKHPPTAEHCLRVALCCSRWAAWRKLPATARDIIEVAALLHDVGKIGVPDLILQKPGELSDKEYLLIESQRRLSEQLLASAGGSEVLLRIVCASQLHFDEYEKQDGLHALAGMLAIVDAYDSMTTEQVFRRALSQERALEELYSNAGTQFAPDLVKSFAELVSKPRRELEDELRSRWLSQLTSELAPGFSVADVDSGRLVWRGDGANGQRALFHNQLLHATTDAVVYLGQDQQILGWNRGAEQLAGRQAESVLHRHWTAELMGLRNISGDELTPEECPLAEIAKTNAQWEERYRMHNARGLEYTVLLRALPVISDQGEYCGSMLILRNASLEADMERKIESLQEIATSDSLTKVANRAELSRQLPEFISSHLEQGQPASLIICDIDYFKKINDTFGHQAGDDALVTFAGLLRENSRDQDLVARFGGEEFIIMCAGCDHSAAAKRAEQIRERVQKTPVPSLDGQRLTSSFGVTAVQQGDTSETLLARADRALMMAKQNGRNRVVQLGLGQEDKLPSSPLASTPRQESKQRYSWKKWFSGVGEPLAGNCYLAAVPKEVAVEKLSGFMNDHHAELVSADETSAVIRVDGKSLRYSHGERATSMIVNVGIKDVQFSCRTDRGTVYQTRTLLDVAVRPYRARDRRSASLRDQAMQLLLSFQSYVVAQEVNDDLRRSIIEPR
jgi:diguanylate cyclase (GGDEF)-like protein